MDWKGRWTWSRQESFFVTGHVDDIVERRVIEARDREVY